MSWAEGARWAIAGIFVVSAVAKVVRRVPLAERRREAEVLGVPAGASALVARLLPVVEVILAVLLVVIPARWPVALAGAFLLLVTVLVVRALSRGVHEPCRCFGALSNKPLSGLALARNIGLIGMTALAWWTPSGVSSPGITAFVCFIIAFGLALLG